MSSTSSTLPSFISSSHLTGRKFSVKEPISVPTRVNFRQLRVSASACSTSTAERTDSRIALRSSLYDVLGVQMGATCQEIKAAYRRLARVLHPDVSNDVAANEFIRLHEAYSTLSDPEKRADYDRSLLFRPNRGFSVSGSMSSGFSGYTGRSWETDQCW